MNIDAIGTPAAIGSRTLKAPASLDELSKLGMSFHGKSVGQRFLGPGWVSDSGEACIVFIAQEDSAPRIFKDKGLRVTLLWRWNVFPSTPISLSPIVEGGVKGPDIRWMCESDSPVVQAIRRNKSFLGVIVNTKGQSSGWFESTFDDAIRADGTPSKFSMQWQFPTPGIRFTNIHERFDPKRTTVYNDENEDEIPLWKEPVADFWATIQMDGVWTKFLTHEDKARGLWAKSFHRHRSNAAKSILTLHNKCLIDGDVPFFDAEGLAQELGAGPEALKLLAQMHPKVATYFANLAGPCPDARLAHIAAVDVFSDDSSCTDLFKCFFWRANAIMSLRIADALQVSLMAAVMDTKFTQCGSHRAWLFNTEDFCVHIRTSPLDLSAPLHDIEEWWLLQAEPAKLFDLGLVIGPTDFPAPMRDVSESLGRVHLESSFENSEIELRKLLHEAKDARQWSVPWGARVEINFGIFVALRIFEVHGDFFCMFLDSQDRYLHVGIGLSDAEPTCSVLSDIIRLRDDDGEYVDNEDAEMSLMLIAAATLRDFLVVEERQSVFGTRHFKRRLRGKDVKTIIYLPRVRYERVNLAAYRNGEPAELRSAHRVAQHLRRAGKASPEQRLLAMRYGIHIPQGFTFVRAHHRGAEAEQERIKVYRSRSALRMIFEAVDTAPSGSRPAWFEFEKDCARILRSQGMQVIHQAASRDGDGGVDLYAVDTDGQSWVVQCKCWSSTRPVGPDVVRELAGAIKLADVGAEQSSKGMIMTTSSFTSGAVTSAVEFGFDVVDGARMAGLLANLE